MAFGYDANWLSYWLIVTLLFKTFPDVAAGFASYPISARSKFFKEKGKLKIGEGEQEGRGRLYTG